MAGKPKFGMGQVGSQTSVKCWTGLLRLQIQKQKSGKVPQPRVDDFGSPVRPSRVCCCPVGEVLPETGDAHSKDPTCARPSGCMARSVALQGKLFAQSGRPRAGAAVRSGARSEIMALSVSTLGNCIQDQDGRVLGELGRLFAQDPGFILWWPPESLRNWKEI